MGGGAPPRQEEEEEEERRIPFWPVHFGPATNPVRTSLLQGVWPGVARGVEREEVPVAIRTVDHKASQLQR